jgi:hypothetical protein
MDCLAAVRCSSLNTSIVALKSGTSLFNVDKEPSEKEVAGEMDRGEEMVRYRGLPVPAGDMDVEHVPPSGDRGVSAPSGGLRLAGRCNASDAARRRRLVVPSALVEPERAEHTIATLC